MSAHNLSLELVLTFNNSSKAKRELIQKIISQEYGENMQKFEELFVILAVGGEHGGQLALDLLLDILRDGQQVTVVLKHLSRNIQR